MELCQFKGNDVLEKFYKALLLLLFTALETYIFSEYRVVEKWEFIIPDKSYSKAFITDSSVVFLIPQYYSSDYPYVDTTLLVCCSFQGVKRWQTRIACTGKPKISVVNDCFLIFSFRSDNKTAFVRVNCKNGEKKLNSIAATNYDYISCVDSGNAFTVNIDSTKNICVLNSIDIFRDKTYKLYNGTIIIKHLGNDTELNDDVVMGIGCLETIGNDSSFKNGWYQFIIKNRVFTTLSRITLDNKRVPQLDSRFYRLDDWILYTSHLWEKRSGHKPQCSILIVKNNNGKVTNETVATISPEYNMINYHARRLLFADNKKTKACVLVLDKLQ